MDGVVVPASHGEEHFGKISSNAAWQAPQSAADAQAVLTLAQNFRESARRGKWSEANDNALGLLETLQSVSAAAGAVCDLGCAGDIGQVRETDALWMASCSARSGVLLIASAFSAHAKRGLLQGAPAMELSFAAAASCAALMPESWPSGAADDLLGMAGLVDALIRVASATCSTGFVILRTRRAAAELLAAALEAAAPAWRQLVETALLREPAHIAPMQALVNVLLGGSPDPRLHEVMLELLWRALRRVATGAALSALASAHPALSQLEHKLPGLCGRIQELTPEELIENAQEFALELSVDGEPSAFACQLDGTGDVAAAVFTEHSISFHQDEDKEPLWEIPWEAIKSYNLRARQAGGSQLQLHFDGEMLCTLTGLPPDTIVPTTVELVFFDVASWELQPHIRIGQADISGSWAGSSEAESGPRRSLHPNVRDGLAQAATEYHSASSIPGDVQPLAPPDLPSEAPARYQAPPLAANVQIDNRQSTATSIVSTSTPHQQAPSSGGPPFLFSQYLGSNAVPQQVDYSDTSQRLGAAASASNNMTSCDQAGLDGAQPQFPGPFEEPAAESAALCHEETPPIRDQHALDSNADLQPSLTQTKLPRADAGATDVSTCSDVVWVSDGEASPAKRPHEAHGTARQPHVQNTGLPEPEGAPAAIRPAVLQPRPNVLQTNSCVANHVISQNQGALVSHQLIGNTVDISNKATASKADLNVHIPDASKRLNALFNGQKAGGNPAQPRARGYAALATGTLGALCKARGLPASTDRQELLTQLNTSLQGGGAAASAFGKNRAAGASKKSSCRNGPRDAVAKVLKDASRLAREVADVQRQFHQSKRALDIQGSEASALLDDIFRASKKQCQGAADNTLS